MTISSNSVIHFTKNIFSLFGILERNFQPAFCKESFSLAGKKKTAYIPMVSFCDIPISQIKEHIGKYGNYGIGLSKEWAIANGLNPVIYLEDKSSVSVTINEWFSTLSDKNTTNLKQKNLFYEFLRNSKNYQGTLVRQDGKTTLDYRFYDEREWRYVLPISSSAEAAVSKANYEGNKERFNESLSEHSLKFEPSDIKYLIVKDETEINALIEKIRNTKRQTYTMIDVEILMTKIITTKQINDDF